MSNSISDSWKMAAIDLDIRVTAPARLAVGDDSVEFDALIRDFGSPAGTAVVALGAVTPARRQAARVLGIYLSELSPDAYGKYDRALFSDTVNDWGWFGDEGQAPAWLRPPTQ